MVLMTLDKYMVKIYDVAYNNITIHIMFNITACIQSLRGMALDKDMVKIYDVAYNNILTIHIILVWF